MLEISSPIWGKDRLLPSSRVSACGPTSVSSPRQLCRMSALPSARSSIQPEAASSPLRAWAPLLPSSSYSWMPWEVKLINGGRHKSFKSEDTLSPKEMSNQWNGTEVVFSNTDGLRQAGFVVDNAESARSGPPWISFPVVFIRCCIC
jgi:hypothetical protein